VATTGQRLRTERERRAISVAQAVDGTHIKTDHIVAMEADDWAAFSAPVYVRGFVKTYARFLRLDEHEMALQLDRELSGTNVFEDPGTASSGLRRGMLDFLMMKLALLRWQVVLSVSVVLGLIALAWGLRPSRVSEAPASSGTSGVSVRLYQPPVESLEGAMLPLPAIGPVTNGIPSPRPAARN
jgi:cytoskeletal protein RodZ